MLLNEFLKEDRKVAELQATIDQLKVTAIQQQNQIQILTAGLQKINAKVQLHSVSNVRTTPNKGTRKLARKIAIFRRDDDLQTGKNPLYVSANQQAL